MQEHVTEERGRGPARVLQFQSVSKLTEGLLPRSSLGASESLVLHMPAVFALFFCVVNLDFLKENTEQKQKYKSHQNSVI